MLIAFLSRLTLITCYGDRSIVIRDKSSMELGGCNNRWSYCIWRGGNPCLSVYFIFLQLFTDSCWMTFDLLLVDALRGFIHRQVMLSVSAVHSVSCPALSPMQSFPQLSWRCHSHPGCQIQSRRNESLNPEMS